MNCSHVQILISAFVDCELDANEKREIRQHVVYCPECGVIYQELVEVKDYLQNIAAVPLHFDPLQDLHLRLSNEEHSLIRQLGKFFWLGRVGLVTVCLTVFFVSSYFLFPVNQSSVNKLVVNHSVHSIPPVNPAAAIDQNFFIDQPVTVYQASFILP